MGRDIDGPHAFGWSAASDGELVTAITERDAAALQEVYRRHRARAHAIARRVCGSRADDVTQEIFLDLWRRPHRFDPRRGSLGAFLAVQARSRSIDGVRADTSRRERELATRDRPASHVSIDDGIVQGQQDAWVRSALAALPQSERDSLTLAFFGGHSYRDVATLLGAPEGTIKSRIRSGLKHLRAELGADLAPVGMAVPASVG